MVQMLDSWTLTTQSVKCFLGLQYIGFQHLWGFFKSQCPTPPPPQKQCLTHVSQSFPKFKNSCGFNIIKVGRGERTAGHFPIIIEQYFVGTPKNYRLLQILLHWSKGFCPILWPTTGFTMKWHVRKKRRNFILMPSDYPDLGCASDWLKQISHSVRPIRSITQMDSEVSSVWNFCTHFLGVFSQGNQWWHRGMSHVFSS